MARWCDDDSAMVRWSDDAMVRWRDDDGAIARWRDSDGTMVRWRWRDRASRHRYRAIALSSSRHRSIVIAPSRYRHRVIAPSRHRSIALSRHRAIAPSRYRAIAPSSSHHCVTIYCQKISAPRKSPEGWPLTFWPKVRQVAPSFHLPLEYEVRSLYIKNIHSYCTRINGLFMSHNDLDLQTDDLSSMCVFMSRCSTKPNMFY